MPNLNLKTLGRAAAYPLCAHGPDDAFAADESGVRWNLVDRVRREIEGGTYDVDVRLDKLIDRLAADLNL